MASDDFKHSDVSSSRELHIRLVRGWKNPKLFSCWSRGVQFRNLHSSQNSKIMQIVMLTSEQNEI